jgi:toluene monooxygenase system protein D
MAVAKSERLVGPVIRGVNQDIAEAVIEAVEKDNPGSEVVVDDRGGYIRIGCHNRCRLTRASLEEAMGETFRLSDLEPALSAFAGRMRYEGDDEVVWYLEREV